MPGDSVEALTSLWNRATQQVVATIAPRCWCPLIGAQNGSLVYQDAPGNEEVWVITRAHWKEMENDSDWTLAGLMEGAMQWR